eukprot:Partr_v1_DN25779_c0_g1_i3_m74423 putative chromatin assembly factor 1 subunit
MANYWPALATVCSFSASYWTVSLFSQKDGSALLWKMSATPSTSASFGMDPDEVGSETWAVLAVLLNPQRTAIYDLNWSADGSLLATASSLDNAVNVYDVTTRKLIHSITTHTHFVQGVAWDPRGEFIASQSSDRSVHVHLLKAVKDGGVRSSTINRSVRQQIHPPSAVASVSSKHDNNMDVEEPVLQPPVDKIKYSKLYIDETFVTFFRRLSFSPDGSLLLCPAGITGSGDGDEPNHCVHIYARNSLNKEPVGSMVGYSRPPTCIRFSPILYQLREDYTKEPSFQLPYRMLAAVGNRDVVQVYDTQRMNPIIQLSNFHYSSTTDIAWHPHGNIMIISSQDGFCSLVHFDELELGERYIAPVQELSTENAESKENESGNAIVDIEMPAATKSQTETAAENVAPDVMVIE